MIFTYGILSICFKVLGYIAFCLNMSLSMFSNADVVHASLVLCEYHFRSLICLMKKMNPFTIV